MKSEKASRRKAYPRTPKKLRGHLSPSGSPNRSSLVFNQFPYPLSTFSSNPSQRGHQLTPASLHLASWHRTFPTTFRRKRTTYDGRIPCFCLRGSPQLTPQCHEQCRNVTLSRPLDTTNGLHSRQSQPPLRSGHRSLPQRAFRSSRAHSTRQLGSM